MSLHIFSP